MKNNTALRNKIYCILVLIAVVVLLSQVDLTLRYTGKDCCGIVGNKVRTWAPVSAVLLCNGFPNERSVSTVSNERSYIYDNVKLFDRNASIEFIIAVGRVVEIKATITVIRYGRLMRIGMASRFRNQRTAVRWTITLARRGFLQTLLFKTIS